MLSHKAPHAPFRKPKHNTLSPSTQYRQLVSRAATQRLHSLSLDQTPPSLAEAWEFHERRIAREKARQQLRCLGVSWEQFVKSVKSAEGEVHVLRAKKYEGALIRVEKGRESDEGAVRRNEAAVKGSQALVFDRSVEVVRARKWMDLQRAQIGLLRMFGEKRVGV